MIPHWLLSVMIAEAVTVGVGLFLATLFPYKGGDG